MACVTRLMCIIVLVLALAAGAEASQTVLFDGAHGQKFTVDAEGPLHLSGLAAIFRAGGASVRTGAPGISDATLEGVDALVISGAFHPLAPQEVEAVLRFMNRGGRLAVMLHIAPPLEPLLDRLAVQHTTAPLREHEDIIGGNPTNFRVTRFAPHPVFRNVTSFSVYGAWGVLPVNREDQRIAVTSESTWVDFLGDDTQRKEATATYGVAVAGDVGQGGYIIFGDDALFQNKFLDDNNKKLAGNLAAWLLRQEKKSPRGAGAPSAKALEAHFPLAPSCREPAF